MYSVQRTHIIGIGIPIRIRIRITHIAPIVGIMPGEMANGQEQMHAEKNSQCEFDFRIFTMRLHIIDCGIIQKN